MGWEMAPHATGLATTGTSGARELVMTSHQLATLGATNLSERRAAEGCDKARVTGEGAGINPGVPTALADPALHRAAAAVPPSLRSPERTERGG